MKLIEYPYRIFFTILPFLILTIYYHTNNMTIVFFTFPFLLLSISYAPDNLFRITDCRQMSYTDFKKLMNRIGGF